jgi:hypothetical protein
MGHVIQPGRLAMAEKKISAVSGWLPPTNKREMRRFTAFCNVYRRFVPNFSDLAAPLNRALKKDQLSRPSPDHYPDRLKSLQTVVIQSTAASHRFP